MNVRYRVELDQCERDQLTALLSGGKRGARKLKRAQILLTVDRGARSHGGAIRGRVCAFLATRAEHPNTQAWGRRKDVKVFGCSDDCARCGTAKVDRMPTNA